MPKIEDTGKVWLRGESRPQEAVRLGETIFVPGKEENQTLHVWMDDGHLYADLHDAAAEIRIVRRFSLNEPPTRSGTLFSGFENTKHGDIMAVTFKDDGVEQCTVTGAEYQSQNAGGSSAEDFARKNGLF